MILSKKNEFIFFKPVKAAGTSIEIALHPFCGENDVITHRDPYDSKKDQSIYDAKGKNSRGYYNHMTPLQVQKKHPKEFETYRKITVIRNPWDRLVSLFYWKQHNLDTFSAETQKILENY